MRKDIEKHLKNFKSECSPLPHPLLIFSQSNYLIQVVDANSLTKWLLQKPTDLGLHCLKRQGISGLSRTRVSLDDQIAKLDVYHLSKVLIFHIYPKIYRHQTPNCTCPKIWTYPLYSLLMCLKLLGELTLIRSQVLWCLIWVYAVCSGLSVRIQKMSQNFIL